MTVSNNSLFPTPFPGNGNSVPKSEFVGCEAAEEFYGWVAIHLAELDRENLVAVHQKIILVTSKYHEWYNRVPEQHRVRVGRRGHQCIFHVFMAALDELIEAKTKMDPPLYFPPPTPRKLLEERGTFLGLIMEPGES
jgi:hypothetical protein